jgi:poly-gamma-glutamate capsule biosynthesis protein CapA/YwtB (metallophosphatase superfamily)
MTATLALAGDTMLGRGVAEVLRESDPGDMVAPEVAEVMRTADLCLVNLECCISTGGRRWPDPGKPFFFRAPPVATGLLVHLGVDAVTLANNHALDFRAEALIDTLDHLEHAGIRAVGAGRNRSEARRPIELEAGGVRIGVVAVTDHPAEFAAAPDGPGVAYAPLRTTGVPDWLAEAVVAMGDRVDVRLVTPHWGPNMTPEPVSHVRSAARTLRELGTELIAGHSAHVFHGAQLSRTSRQAVLYDLGDFIDDYAVDPLRRNDLGLLWRVTLEPDGPVSIDAWPLSLRFARTELAADQDRDEIVGRLTMACEAMGTRVDDMGDRLRLSGG